MVKDLLNFYWKYLYLFRCPQQYSPWNEHRSFQPKNHFCAHEVTKSANNFFSNWLQLLVSFMVKRIHFCPFGGGFLPKVTLLGIQVVVLEKIPLYPLQYDSTWAQLKGHTALVPLDSNKNVFQLYTFCCAMKSAACALLEIEFVIKLCPNSW